MKRAVLAMIVCVGCGSAAPAPPANASTDRTPPAATTICYEDEAKPGQVARRIVDPVARTISVQFFDNGAPTSNAFVVAVDGDHFADAVPGGSSHSEGHLVGPPWHWTSWTTTITFKTGVRTLDETVTPTGLRANIQTRWRSGKIETSITNFRTIGCGGLHDDANAGPGVDI